MLPTKFQRRLKCEKLMDNRRRTPSDGKSSHCLWQGELKSIIGPPHLLILINHSARAGNNIIFNIEVHVEPGLMVIKFKV
jgi:hypothetical protein